jgi:hypothetical protein
MPIYSQDPLSAMLGLSSRYAPQINLEADRVQRLREMKRNRELNPRGAGATASDVADLESDIQDDPYTGDEADAEVVYNSPFEVEKRNVAKQDALNRLLLPEKLRGENQMALEHQRGENAVATEEAKTSGKNSLASILTPQAYDQEARAYNKSRILPSGLTRSPQDIGGIVNRAAELFPDSDVAGNAAGYKADAASLGKLQANLDAATAFSNVADLNASRLQEIMPRVPNTGMPWLNRLVRPIASEFGNTSLSELEAIRQSVAGEYNRIINNPNMTGVVADAARQDLNKILDPNATPDMIAAALSQLFAEAKNRVSTYEGQVGHIKERISTPGGRGAPPPRDLGADWGR